MSDGATVYSPHAENAVLGSLMVDERAFDRVADRVRASDFRVQGHEKIFDAITRLIERGAPCDAVTVSDELERTGDLDEVGGLAYVGTLAKDVPSVANVGGYADIVRDHSIRRRIISQAAAMIDAARDGAPAAEVLDTAQAALLELSQKTASGPVRVGDSLSALVEDIDARVERGAPSGLLTDWRAVDALTGGLDPGTLTIVAGRPAMGKTAFALHLASSVALRESPGPGAVLFVSLEMTRAELVERLVAQVGRVDSAHLRAGTLDDEDWPRFTSGTVRLKDAPLFIDDSARMTLLELRARARRQHRTTPLALVVVDYLQLMHAPGRRDRNREREIAEISSGLKALAKELQVPVVALSQLNRALEQRQDRRPILADLRESGAIEQDADVVAFVYRDEVYYEDSPDRGVAEIIIAKNRHGRAGRARLAFLAETGRFEPLAGDDDPLPVRAERPAARVAAFNY
jgi:replicative DNA helicase